MFNLKEFIISLLIPFIAGGIGFLLSGNSTQIYNSINMPSFAPPGFIFPIAWSILYLLMGISYYFIIRSKNSKIKSEAISIYFIQLVLNALWTLVFFRLRQFLLGFIWIIVLIILVSYMIFLFFKINKKAAYLQIPYLLWLIFASILSYTIYILN